MAVTTISIALEILKGLINRIFSGTAAPVVSGKHVALE
jgi:hypothetical protein